MNAKEVDESLTNLHKRASSVASAYVEDLARKILSEHPALEEFVMGMGTWLFTHKDGNDRSGSDQKYLKVMDDFIMEWDSTLKITGEPMRFTATGPKRSNW